MKATPQWTKSPQAIHLIQNIPIKEEIISLPNITILIVILLTELEITPNSEFYNKEFNEYEDGDYDEDYDDYDYNSFD